MPPEPFEFFSSPARAPLAAFVESIWAVRGSSNYQRFTMLPNGAVQLMINFGAAHTVIEAGGRRRVSAHRRAWLAGVQDGPLAIESPPTTDLLAIRFRTGGAHAFLRAPLEAVTNDVVDADALFGPAIDDLREQLALAGDRRAQLAAAETWLLRRFRPREHDFRLLTAANDLLTAERRAAIGEACEQLGLGNVRMIRLFRRLAGLPPKTMASVQRFHDALGLLAKADGAFADLALRLGYYDQAHFNREFVRFAGVAPGVFIRRRGPDNESLVDG